MQLVHLLSHGSVKEMRLMSRVMSVVCSLFVVTVSSSGFARFDTSGKKMPEALIIKSVALETADQALAEMLVSPRHEMKFGNGAENLEGPAREIEYLRDFVRGTGAFSSLSAIPNSEKRIDLVRYRVGLPEVVDLLLEAKAKGFGSVRVVTDFNTGMVTKMESSERKHSDLRRARYREGPTGDFIKRLHEEGFTAEDSKYSISSIPFYDVDNPNLIAPSMHKKSMILSVDNAEKHAANLRKAGFTLSAEDNVGFLLTLTTGNLTNPSRFNRMFRFRETYVYKWLRKNTESMIKGYAEGLETTKLPPAERLRILYRDGSFLELAASDGNINPNDRIEAVLKSPDLRIDEVVFSHFSLTHGGVVSAMQDLLRSDSPPRVLGIVDHSFGTNFLTFGRSATLIGHDVMRPYPLRDVLVAEDRMLENEDLGLLVYLRQLQGVTETDIEDAHITRYLWHDKTTLLYTTDKKSGKKWAYLFSGSMNLSSHARNNADLQFVLRVPWDSPVLQATRESILSEMAEDSPYVSPMKEALLRNGLAAMTGLRPFEVSRTHTMSFMRAMDLGNIREMARIVRELNLTPTTLTTRKSLALREKTLGCFIDLMIWLSPQEGGLEKIKQKRLFSVDNIPEQLEFSGRAREFSRNALLAMILFTERLAGRQMGHILKRFVDEKLVQLGAPVSRETVLSNLTKMVETFNLKNFRYAFADEDPKLPVKQTMPRISEKSCGELFAK